MQVMYKHYFVWKCSIQLGHTGSSHLPLEPCTTSTLLIMPSWGMTGVDFLRVVPQAIKPNLSRHTVKIICGDVFLNTHL